MTTKANRATARMILQHGLTDKEKDEEFERAWIEEFGEDASKPGSIDNYSFLAHHYAGTKRLEKVGLLELFHNTQRLPDYQRAEDAVKRGWARWVELEFGIPADQARNKLEIQQFVLLYQLHYATSREARQRILKSRPVPCYASAAKGDDVFFRKLGDALSDPARRKADEHDFAQLLLHNWLTGFWWLMPLKNVAADMARIQGTPTHGTTVDKLNQRLRQIRSRRVEGRHSAYYSAGWTGCFYSTSPPLIDFIDSSGHPHLNQLGRRLLV